MNTETRRTRIDKGNYVKADVTGRGKYVYGIVTLRGKTKTAFDAADGSGIINAHNSIVIKITRAEFDAAIHKAVSEFVAERDKEKVVKDDVIRKAKPDASVAQGEPTPAKSIELLRETSEGKAGEAGDAEPKATGPKLKPDLSRYTAYNTQKTATGRASVDIGDHVADLLRGHDLYRCRVLTYRALMDLGFQTFSKRKIHLSTQNLEAQYRHLNAGMQRMNLGNLIRSAMNEAGVSYLDIYRLAQDLPSDKMSQTMAIK